MTANTILNKQVTVSNERADGYNVAPANVMRKEYDADMTNQRFTEYEDENYWNVVKDLQTGKVYDDAEEIADLLNQLWNARERCRNTNTALHKDFDKLWRICMDTGLTRDEIIEAMDK